MRILGLARQADLGISCRLVPAYGYVFGPGPTALDATIHGFVANSLFYEIDNSLRRLIAYQLTLIRHCRAIDAAITGRCSMTAPGKRHAASPVVFDMAHASKGVKNGHEFSITRHVSTFLVEFIAIGTVKAGLRVETRHAPTSVLPCSISSFAPPQSLYIHWHTEYWRLR
ncbi:hypothetical protein [Ancylobacter sp.]|uniref:hypothetical protein n=1 Tax=Ancylobacter sp. TaxID=1872567 RepID=UPI003D0B7073